MWKSIAGIAFATTHLSVRLSVDKTISHLNIIEVLLHNFHKLKQTTTWYSN
jgi:hypothetical protein